MSSLSRFNPKAGIADFWHEFRKPNPLRVPILLASMLPFAVIFYWLGTEKFYKEPERPQITYIDSYAPDRTDAEIIASNEANQEVQDLREAELERLAERKRELYKALGAAAGMDVDKIAEEADRKRAAEEAAEAQRRAELFGRDAGEEAAPDDNPPSEENKP